MIKELLNVDGFQDTVLNGSIASFTKTECDRPSCPYCSSERIRKKGANKETGNKRFFCIDCNKIFSTATTIKPLCPHCGFHSIIKCGNKANPEHRYKCTSCNIIFDSEEEVENGSSRPPCPHCGSLWNRKKGRTGRVNDLQLFLCNGCKKVFSFSSRAKPSLNCPYCQSDHLRFAGKRHDNQSYRCKECNRTFTEKTQIYTPNTDPELEYQKDKWDLGVLSEILIGTTKKWLIFEDISQLWLRNLVKRYCRYKLSILAPSSVVGNLKAIRDFSKFLEKHYPSVVASSVSRSVLEHFLSHLQSTKTKYGTQATTASRYRDISSLNNFLETCKTHGWADFSKCAQFYKEDRPQIELPLPKFIPEEVMSQLVKNIDELPEPYMRMVLIIIEVGMRISELVSLKLDCISQDREGDWFLHRRESKMSKFNTVPISRECAAVIQEQQKFIKENLLDDFVYLFCARKPESAIKFGNKGFVPIGKTMLRESFTDALNTLANRKNICDSQGRLWHFHSHQFRHSVATKMVNTGVPIQVIQRFLGHASPDMTMRYAHLFDKTLKDEIAKYQGKVVNIAGEIVQTVNPELDDVDLQWVKRSIQAQALPNGSCALPTVSQECPHANACLTCSHFRTTIEFINVHKEELEQTNKIIEKAKTNGWTRQIEMNEKTKKSLEKVIDSLEII